MFFLTQSLLKSICTALYTARPTAIRWRQIAQAGFALTLLLSVTSLAIGYAEDALSVYEQSLFSQSYQSEALESRLTRLETSILGEAQSGSALQRRDKLLNILGNIKPMLPNTTTSWSQETNSPAASASPTFAKQNTPSYSSSTPYPGDAPPLSQDATDYPAITALERQIFHRDFVREDLRYRLARLEKKVYGQAASNKPLADRVDRLLASYPDIQATPGSSSGEAQEEVSSAIRGLPESSSQFVSRSRDVYTKLDALEKYFFNGRTYPNELLTERLDRLEKSIYPQAYSGESVDGRVRRLTRSFEVQVASANQTTRPVTQNRPGFASPPSQNSATVWSSSTSTNTLTPSSSAQNIRIGSTYAETGTHQFSPEMMRMLPPNVRSQLSSGGQTSGTVVRAPATVIIEKTQIQPGFQTYGGLPIQQYHYYGMPANLNSRSTTTTTVIQPDGTASVYGYQGSTIGSTIGSTTGLSSANGLPTPYYVGDPALLQALGNLEMNVYAQINTVEPVFTRLGRLEASLLGQIYPSAPENQRLANLQKAYQLQSVGRLLGKSKAGDIGRTAGGLLLGVPLTPANTTPGVPVITTPSRISPLGVPIQ